MKPFPHPYTGEKMKLVKHTKKEHSHRFFKPQYLNTPLSIAKRQKKEFIRLRSLGMPPFKAYQKSRR
jgi:hypothetical protein